MKRLLEKLFGSPPPNDGDLITKINNLDLLATSIAGIGYWTWWAEELPGKFQLEFNGTQLFFKEREGNSPSTQVAIQFINPKTISFISRDIEGDAEGEKWYDLLHQDKLDPPNCSHDRFTFTDVNTIKSILNEVEDIHTFHGYRPELQALIQEPITLVFWAGSRGMIIGSEKLQIWTKDGAIPLRNIPELRSKWWAYWEEYWNQKDTNDPLPYDPVCEVCIPAVSSN